MVLKKQEKRQRRHKRVRAKISGTLAIPRLCVSRTNSHIYAQLIDDEKGHTLLTASDFEIKSAKRKAQSAKPQLKTKSDEKDKKEAIMMGKVAVAYEVGRLIAKEAQEKKIEKVVFDRGGYKYHGRVKALAEGAREGGLKF